ncbi:ABC transporter ATP-binding protein [uncultured Nitratireductor sp.]|uniref:ABC transporter ATP-binding protein n=1 Tax=uncultured Nitratireductor sp. TaxID=520953 RepID=UPI0025CC0256|nr:ABC transporter ATP-binding protein [uncultured Nitratireductor sp.]
MPLLSVQDLVTEFHGPSGAVRAVDRVNFDIQPGEIFGIVGESGCGKSATCRSILRLFGGANARVAGGRIMFDDRTDLASLPERDLGKIRGNEIAFIFQDPLTALNPTMRIGRQIGEVIENHAKVSRREARERVLGLMRDVHITSPERRLDAYPHELSGGLRQRVMIAMALALQPRLIIADEPTTALDVTVQDQILRLLLDRRDKMGTAIIMVTHDIGVISEICDRVAVMYAGRIVETGAVDDVLDRAQHPYTKSLLAALPSLAQQGKPLIPIEGSPPNLLAPPPGCRFAPRCTAAHGNCSQDPAPVLMHRRGTASGHADACILER